MPGSIGHLGGQHYARRQISAFAEMTKGGSFAPATAGSRAHLEPGSRAIWRRAGSMPWVPDQVRDVTHHTSALPVTLSRHARQGAQAPIARVPLSPVMPGSIGHLGGQHHARRQISAFAELTKGGSFAPATAGSQLRSRPSRKRQARQHRRANAPALSRGPGRSGDGRAGCSWVPDQVRDVAQRSSVFFGQQGTATPTP
jgi:hypothetical protein